MRPRFRQRRALVWIGPVLAALAVAACGSDEDGAGDDFSASADAICTQAAEEGAEIALSFGPDEVSEQLLELAASGERTVDELEALEPPEGSEDSWADYVANRRESVAVIERRADASESGDRAEATASAEEQAQLLEERDAIAEDLGLEACARVLPAAEEDEVREVVELATVSGDGARVCEEAVAASFIDERFGGSVERCARAQTRAQVSDSVEFETVKGVAGVQATAEVSLSGGSLDGSSATIDLVFEDGGFRILQVTPQE